MKKGIRLTAEQVECLETLLNYTAWDECEDDGGRNLKTHIWASIRPLYEKIFGKEELKKLEDFYKEQR